MSGSKGNSSSASSSTSSSRIWEEQAPFLKDLYQQASGVFDKSTAAVDRIMPGVEDAFGRMLSPGVNPQLAAYQTDVQNNLERNLLPAIQSGSIATNQLGGSRQQLGAAQAVADSNQQITDMASDLYGQDQNRVLGAIMGAGNLINMQTIPGLAYKQMIGPGEKLVRSDASASSDSKSLGFGL